MQPQPSNTTLAELGGAPKTQAAVMSDARCSSFLGGWTVQAALTAIAIFITMAGSLGGAYYNILQFQTSQQAMDENMKSRLDAFERKVQQLTEVDDRVAGEMRISILQLHAEISDLRVLEAQKPRNH